MNSSLLRSISVLPLLLAAGCRSGTTPAGPADGVDSAPPGLDVSVRLGSGEVRAGVVADGAALFGGTSAEGRPGDLKIYNDRAQFIIQGVRDGAYYESIGGGVIDIDVVRPEGEPGRDVIDELSVMVGLGRLVSPDSVVVVADGSDGAAAVVRVSGRGVPMQLLTGALESPTFVPDLPMAIVTDYRLEPDSWLLEATTTVTFEAAATAVQAGDLAMVGMEVIDPVLPGRGLQGGAGAPTGDWLGLVGRNNEVAVAILSDAAPFSQSAIGQLLGEIGPVMTGLTEPGTYAAGESTTWTRAIGVGPDLATVTAAWHDWRGDATSTVGGQVTADGAPVAGARVHVLADDGGLETLAFTDEDGSWSAAVTAGSPTALASGRGHGHHIDLPGGAGWVAPYAHEVPASTALDSLEVGALEIPFAEGFGVSAPIAATSGTALTLEAPGVLAVTVADGGPAVVRVDFAGGDPAGVDPAYAPGRPSGAAAYGYVRDGDLDLSLEPGEYQVTVHRGVAWELTTEAVTIESGGRVSLSADLVEVVAPAGVLRADPHSHSAPSGDGEIGMSHRLLTHAANGVQVHIGTDHDHVADYRPMLAPLGLTGWMTSVVADEYSPTLRGHVNVYPLEIDPDAVNNGAVRWWEGISSDTTTSELYDTLHASVGDAVVQINHPAGSSGMLGQARYDAETGVVERPDRFSEDFDAMEVLNDGSYDEYLPLYLSLVGRGHPVAPTGVSDSHGYRNGVGVNVTWVPVGIDEPADLDPRALAQTIRAGRTVISRGPYLDATVGGAWAPGETIDGGEVLTVAVWAPSWIQVDRLLLLRDGEEVERRAHTGAPEDFLLDPDRDAYYVVIAEGDTPMLPAYSERPWAMTAAIRVDVDGGGWTPPHPAWTLGD